MVVVKDDMYMRMAYTMRKTIRINALSSIFIGLIYYSCILSELMPIQAVGAFAGTLIIVNFIIL